MNEGKQKITPRNETKYRLKAQFNSDEKGANKWSPCAVFDRTRVVQNANSTTNNIYSVERPQFEHTTLSLSMGASHCSSLSHHNSHQSSTMSTIHVKQGTKSI